MIPKGMWTGLVLALTLWGDGCPELLLEAQKKGCQAEDLAKWVQQAVLGPGHLLASPERARKALEEEWMGLEPEKGVLVEYMGPTNGPGSMARIHLRTWKALGGSVGSIWEGMLRTARQGDGDPSALGRVWGEILHLSRQGRIPQKPGALHALTSDLCGSTRVFRHSASYHEHQMPAYRVLSPALLEACRKEGEPHVVPKMQRE